MSRRALLVCLCASCAVAPLWPTSNATVHLSKDQSANINIAAGGITVLRRLVVGPLCARLGPGKADETLLALGAVPVLGIACATSYASGGWWRSASRLACVVEAGGKVGAVLAGLLLKGVGQVQRCFLILGFAVFSTVTP